MPPILPTRANFLAVIFQVPVGMPARIHSPFLSVRALSWRLKSPMKSRMTRPGPPACRSSTTLPRMVPAWADAAVAKAVSRTVTAPIRNPRMDVRAHGCLLD